MSTARFKPQKFSRHFASLEEQLAPATRSGFLLSSDSLSWRTEVDHILVKGDFPCEGGIRVEIEERLRIARRAWWIPLSRRHQYAELTDYCYNAVLLNRGNIFRYNSPHTDHRTFHHVHRYDVLGSGAETVEPVKERDVPTLRQVLGEAETWYWEHLRKE